jgi:hypothetical protein
MKHYFYFYFNFWCFRARKWARQTVRRMSSINWLDWTDFDEGTSLFMFACYNDAGTFGGIVFFKVSCMFFKT